MSIVGGSRAKIRSIQKRAYGRNREALDREWLRDSRLGKTTEEIATKRGVSKRTVQLALQRARAAEEAARQAVDRAESDDPELPIRDETAPIRRPWWLELVPLFPISGFTPNSRCPHHGPIRPGSLFCCMVCSASGVDDHPYLQRDPKTDPLPEPPRADGSGGGDSTRKARKARRRDEKARGDGRTKPAGKATSA